MKLFLVLIILLFEVLTDGARLKKCFNKVTGYCRKKCKVGERYEIGCLSGKLCCANDEEEKKHVSFKKPHQHSGEKLSVLQDYIILPTITIFTV
ncbi:beta-defensin 128 precursor [Homo sapiens]|uniref:Beta-defensin 128 n=1 Tax=Homo sapiens TaxID=9606 RepID=DB128_HUMAN|nr:beta-defensin 128 precursor [Homo sapiens]Q7Z7B8.1 RecName: Full=Beta-defensin 128; AltName: Full=Beta-defensin 28; Short=DEFB-28; AltName: Full=Defensin, beta 128; Flags: Precursor [Homo sapiens]AAP47223.1 beta-defensin 28 precursor [Homo sapiens]KAI2593711.1 defensin beta 128 [Homo sapiens]|eukprot:NP_001032821.1 beta-defensin 128 precursor [Homo sapiens]